MIGFRARVSLSVLLLGFAVAGIMIEVDHLAVYEIQAAPDTRSIAVRDQFIESDGMGPELSNFFSAGSDR